MLTQVDTANDDLDLATGANAYSATPDASNHAVYQAVIKLGDGTKNLDGTGGDFTVKITIGSQVFDGGGVTKTLGTETRAMIITSAFVVPANESLTIHVTSPNAGDSDVDTTVELYRFNDANLKAIAGTPSAATKLGASAGTIITGTVSNANTTPSTTVFAADDITEETADHFNGRIVIFTSGALQNQATDITDYELDSGEGKFTVTAMTEAPANDDTFVIV